MVKLARWCATHRRYVLGGWVVVVLALGFAARVTGAAYSSNFTLPGSDAQRASDLLAQNFPEQAGERDQIVFAADRGTLLGGADRAHVDTLLAGVARLPHVHQVISPFAARGGPAALSKSGRVGFATVVFDDNSPPAGAVRRLIAAAAAARGAGLEVALNGDAISQAEQQDLSLASGIGLIAAIVVLLMTFGSLVAMGLPIVTAMFALGSGIALITLVTHVVAMPNFSSELATMIGLGVGIDYALFIVTRFREAYITPGPTFGNVVESVVAAMNTAGRAVLFAGITVVIALLGMLLLGVGLLSGAAIASAVGVLTVMIGAVTALPALMAAAGHRLARAGWRTANHGGSPPDTSGAGTGGGAWLRWSAFVARHPWQVATVATVAIALLIAPVATMRLGSSDASTDPSASNTHRAYELLARGFGSGRNGPLLLVAQADHGRTLTGSDLSRLSDAVAAHANVASVTAPRLNGTDTVATLSVYPRSAPQAYATTALVATLRERVVPPVEAGAGMHVYVGGDTAGSIDFATTIDHKLPLFIGVVIALSALLLMVVFRSLLIPLQAAFMNLLSIGASLGVVVAIFQWGWLDRLAGIASGPVDSFVPVMLFAIVFGLSMDYEVFIISRIHEQWRRTGSCAHAVGQGLALTGRVITAAGAIMVCVFLSFFLGDERVVQEFGLSLATAVFVDALLVRCLLLPAVLNLTGEWTWHMPAWLQHVIPHIDVDGLGRRPALPAAVRAAAAATAAAAAAAAATAAPSPGA
jgi:RND superfamily putative drug exporter